MTVNLKLPTFTQRMIKMFTRIRSMGVRRNCARNFFPTLVALLLFSGTSVYAQAQGRVVGRVIDSNTGEAMFGVVVAVDGQQVFGQTDFDGRFQIALPPGAYTLRFKVLTFGEQVRQVTVPAAGAVNINVALGAAVAQEVRVEGRRITNTEASMLSLQRKAASVSDGISSEAIRRSPDSSASDAVRRVTGISVVGGKYVFVRGLGERYSQTMLNGALLSSPESDRRVVPLDLFPASLIKNIRVIKSFLPEDPGEFSGGLVKIETVEYPEEFLLSVGVGLGYNTDTTTQQFRTYTGGQRDWTGKDDGARDRPDIVAQLPEYVPFVRGDIFGGLPAQLVQVAGALFPNTWDPQTINAPFDRDFKLTVGDSLPVLDGGRFGYVYGTSYSRKWRDTEEIEKSYAANNLINAPVEDTIFILPKTRFDIDKSVEEVLWGHNLNLTFEPTTNHRISSKTFYSRNSDKTVREAEGYRSNSNLTEYFDFREIQTGWIEREVFHQTFSGEHGISVFDPAGRPHKFSWNLAYSQADRNEPNLTTQGWEKPSGAVQLKERAAGSFFNLRIYNESEDTTRSGQVAYELPFQQWDGLNSTIKIGAFASDRLKKYRLDRYQSIAQPVQTPANLEFVPGSITYGPWSYLVTPNLFRFEEATGIADAYDSTGKIHAYFGQVDMPLVDKLRFVGGARYEDSFQYIYTYEQRDPITGRLSILRNTEGVLRTKDTLPSANFIYELQDDMNLRLGYAESVNRPDLRDLSEIGFSPTIGGERVFGNRFLQRAYLHNYDARWEWYMTAEEYLGAGVFQKSISGPIEKVGIATSNETRDFALLNAKDGEVRGLEFEVRKDFLERFGLQVNLFLIRSHVELLTWERNALFRLGYGNALRGEGLYTPTNLESRLVGQSDRVLNTRVLYYLDGDKTSSVSLLYTAFSDRLQSNGANGAPDTIEKGAGILDFVAEGKFYDQWDWKFAAKNLLNTRFKVVQENPLFGTEELVNSYREGLSFSISLGYKF